MMKKDGCELGTPPLTCGISMPRTVQGNSKPKEYHSRQQTLTEATKTLLFSHKSYNLLCKDASYLEYPSNQSGKVLRKLLKIMITL